MHPNTHSCIDALLNDNPELLEWMYKRGAILNSDVYNAALSLSKTKIETLEWLKKRGCTWNDQTFECACEDDNDLELIKYLYDDGCIPTELVFYYCVINRDISILEWIYNHNFPYNERNCVRIAIEEDSLDVLEWMNSKNFIFTREDFELALSFDFQEIVDFLKDKFV